MLQYYKEYYRGVKRADEWNAFLSYFFDKLLGKNANIIHCKE